VGGSGVAGTASAALPGDTGQDRHWWAGHESALPSGLDWLSARERARLDAMRFTKRRTEYLLRRWVGKRAVTARLGLPSDPGSLARVEVLNRPTGAPYVEVEGASSPWEVSLTDRAGCAVAGIGAAAEGGRGGRDGRDGRGGRGTLGVDLEVVEPRSEGIVTDFLTPAERHWVSAEGSTAARLGRDAAANLVWSAKEAALKVLHVGLRADTRWVEVAVATPARDDGWAPFTATWRDTDVLHGWWRRDGHYLLTVAARGDGEPPAALAGAVDLAVARPVHSWVEAPLVTPGE
jgi:4'-phosphopantetheinyl transferase